MELREIESFLRVAKYKSFSRAAERLGYTQAAITIQIKNLERELGVHLFDRIGKKTLLTQDGELFLRHAEAVMQHLAEAREELTDHEHLRGRLSIGAIESVCSSILPDLLRAYHQKYPDVRFDIVIDSPDRLLEKMDQNELDLVYVLDQKIYGNHWNKAMEEPEQIVFVAARGGSCDGQVSVKLEEILKKPFILTERGASYRYILDSYLKANGFELHPFAEMGNTEVLIRLLKNSDSVSFLPLYTVREEIERGTLFAVPVEDFEMRIWRQMLYHKDKWVTREMKAFFELALCRGTGAFPDV